MSGFFSMCQHQSGPSSTSMTSAAFHHLNDKISYLENYVKFRRAYQSLEYVVVYHNNSEGLLSGPSDWDIRLHAKVLPQHIEQWIQGTSLAMPSQIDWIKTIPGNPDSSGFKEWYQSQGIVVGINRANSEILYRNKSE